MIKKKRTKANYVPPKKYTFEACRDEALKYKYLVDFRKKSRGYYDASIRYGYANRTNSHLKKVGNMHNRCIYACVFKDRSIYIGLTFNLEDRKVCRLNNKRDAATIHSKKTGLSYVTVQLTPYVDTDIAVKMEGSFIERYKRMGWNVLNRDKAGSLGGFVKWTEESVRDAASKCSSRSDFEDRYSGALSKAKSLDIYDELCSKLFPLSHEVWTDDEIWEIALKHTVLKEFVTKDKKAFMAAYNRGMFDEVTAHMKRERVLWTIALASKEALKYKSRGEFSKKCQAAYLWAIRHNHLDEICSHMPKRKKYKNSK